MRTVSDLLRALDDASAALADERAAFRALAWLFAAGLLVSTAEYLWSWRQFRREHIYAWKILGLRRPVLGGGVVERAAALVLGFPGVMAVLVLQFAAAAVLLAPAAPAAALRGAVLVLALTLPALHFRNGAGDDGSDQMNSVLLAGLLCWALAPGTRIAAMGLWFVALQACLAYAASGISKAVSPMWRSGGAVFHVMNTVSYGSRPVALLLKDRPALHRALSWAVIVMESAFPLVLFVPAPYAWAFLAWGASFHLFCAMVMGLNSFFWAFVATYPALLYGNRAIAG